MRADLERAANENKNDLSGYRKSVARVEKYLQSDEEVLYISSCQFTELPSDSLKIDTFKFDGKELVLFVATTKKILVYYKLLFNEKIKQFPVDEIKEFQVAKSKIAASTKFRITTLTTEFDLGIVRKDSAAKLEKVLSDYKKRNFVALHSDTASNPFEAVERLSQMLDNGIITKTEFEEKKAELLKRI